MRTAVCLTVGLVVAGWAVGGPADPLPPPRVDTPATPYGVSHPPFAHPPASSCAAASCHGGSQPGRPGSEHTTWAAPAVADGPHDPHAKAYRVLFNEDSVRISRLLGRPPAHQDALCLKCHAEPGVEPASAADGVGCGACHGPAEKWLTAHCQPGWKGLSNRTKWDEYGFVPTKNLVARTMTCTACHVGASDREVNHDLIAAGHPRLNFEAARFHTTPQYRKHWQERTPQPDFEVRAWAVGQVASLRAAADLLRARAERAERAESPWPEFAAHSCYACHQGIGGEPRGDGAAVGRPLGRPGWEVWYTAAATVALDHAPALYPGVGRVSLKGLDDLKRLMAGPHPKPAAVKARAAAAVADLDRWLAAAQLAEDGPPARVPPDLPAEMVRALAQSAATADGRAKDSDWDFLAAHYLGCGAMYHAAGGKTAHPEWAAPLKALGAGLRFPPPIGRTRTDSPAGFGREKLIDAGLNFGRLAGPTSLTGVRR